MRAVALRYLFLILCCVAAGLGPRFVAWSLTPVEQFYLRIQGDWVGTSVVRVGDEEPTTTYFRLAVAREDAHTFREEYQYFRQNPETGALDPFGTQTNIATLEPDGSVKCVSTGRGMILIDRKVKRQSWQTTGCGSCAGATQFQAEVSGTVLVDGMPLGLGRKGRIQKCRASWTLQGENLVGKTEMESRFRALVVNRRYRITGELRAERGTDLWAVAGRRTLDARR